jgi:hypothetical protein
MPLQNPRAHPCEIHGFPRNQQGPDGLGPLLHDRHLYQSPGSGPPPRDSSCILSSITRSYSTSLLKQSTCDRRYPSWSLAETPVPPGTDMVIRLHVKQNALKLSRRYLSTSLHPSSVRSISTTVVLYVGISRHR